MSGAGHWIFLNASAPWCWAAGALALAALWSGYGSSRGRSPKVRALLLAVRALAVIAALIAVLSPAREADLVRAKRPPLAVIVDDSKSMVIGSGAPGLSHAEWLKKNAGRLAELEKVYRVEYFGLGPAPLTGEGKKGLPADAKWFAAESSPVGRTLEEIARIRPDADAMILLSDGRDTERPGAAYSPPMPVFPVKPDLKPPPDVWLDSLKSPPVGFIRTPVEISVGIGSSGFPEGSAELTLVEDGSPVLTKTVRTGAGKGEVTLSFTPRRTGRKAYRLELSPRPGEASLQNNSAQFTMNVIRDKTRILLVAGTPTWDVKSLRRRLIGDPGVDLITFMILRTPMDSTSVDTSELSLIPFPTEDLFNKELPSFDAVFLVNFDYGAYVPVSYLSNLEKFVRDAGGGLVMIGGDRSFGLGGYHESPLANVLPVDLSGAPQSRLYSPMEFRPRLTPAGEIHPVTRVSGLKGKTGEAYLNLPELTGLNWALKPKSGASVLMEAPMLKNEHGPAAVVAVGETGAGRVMAVLTDSLWRWSNAGAAGGGDETFYGEFWTRALRWLVHDPDMELVRLNPPSSGIRAGSSVTFGARVLDRGYRPAQGAVLKGELKTEGGQKTELVFREKSPGEYASESVVINRSGLARVMVDAELGGSPLGRDEAGFAVEPPSPEPLRIGVDSEYLEKTAAKSGGKVYSGEDSSLFDMLMERGGKKTEVVGREIEQPWLSWWALAALAALMALDWTLRRILE